MRHLGTRGQVVGGVFASLFSKNPNSRGSALGGGGGGGKMGTVALFLKYSYNFANSSLDILT